MGLALQELDMRDQGNIKKHSPLQGYMPLLDALHVEANGWDGAMAGVSAGLSDGRAKQQKQIVDGSCCCRLLLRGVGVAYSTVNSPP